MLDRIKIYASILSRNTILYARHGGQIIEIASESKTILNPFEITVDEIENG